MNKNLKGMKQLREFAVKELKKSSLCFLTELRNTDNKIDDKRIAIIIAIPYALLFFISFPLC